MIQRSVVLRIGNFGIKLVFFLRVREKFVDGHLKLLGRLGARTINRKQ